MPKIPYVVSDFKPDDIVHVIGEYDGQDFDDVGTVITTSDYVDNPYSGEASILVRFDNKRDAGRLHDGGTSDVNIRKACDNRCWWLAEWQWNPEKNFSEYQDVDYDYNHLEKINDNLPNVYDLITSLTESDAKNKFGLHSLKQGDKAIFSFQHQKGQKADKVIGTLLNNPDSYNRWYLIKFDNWHGGHDGHDQGPGCGKDDCFFLIAEDYPERRFFDYITVEPLANPYELISSLFEAEEDGYDWAYELSKNVDLKSAELTQIPKKSMMMWYLILFDRPGLKRDVIEKSFKYIKDKTKWEFNCFSKNIDQCIDTVYDYYNQYGTAYIVLKPITHIGVKQGFGHTVKLFEGGNNKKITDKDIVIIRPY